MNINNSVDLINLTGSESKISQIILQYEMENSGLSREEIYNRMKQHYDVMVHSIQEGLSKDVKSVGGLLGGQGKSIKQRYDQGKTICGITMAKAIASALAVSEVNAAMGQIVAAPTAGSCGVLPGALFAAAQQLDAGEEEIIMALFTACAVGLLFAKNATISGAEGGCQAETGVAAAMAAAAIVELAGGSPQQALHGAAMTIQNILGLVCDPIAGLVEDPCAKRNALGAANALICAEMAVAGIKSVIPFDEVVESMYRVGRAMPCELRETSLGGLASTPAAKKIEKQIFG